MKKQVKTALIAAFLVPSLLIPQIAEARHPFKRAGKAIIGLPICLCVGGALGIGTGLLMSLTGPALWIDMVRTDAALDRLEDEEAAKQAAQDQAK